ncbi:Peptidyl-dipeptidase A precursor [Labilithrix luteola]|uniref:Peptidyl-dipeptidase A n=1 Tax=Labilithrix luteola TaxID=1391654 RepID=A0A0K1QGU8_9BACT|nr:M2 family metallopeptidase [Labilithrix luteola]AKV04660.1 Peptidyl-dipeptidase A precursor [Labilithrix luteola]
MKLKHRLFASLAPVIALAACGGGEPSPQVPSSTVASGSQPTTTPSAPATAEEAKKFVAQVDKELRHLWIARDSAGWVNQNFITDDTEALSAAGEEATAAYVSEAIQKARRFDGVQGIDPDTQRQLLLLKLAQVVPAPSNAAEREELAKLQSEMTATYGKGKYCPPEGHLMAWRTKDADGKPLNPPKACLNLDDLSRIIKKSRNEAELLEAWKGWHSIAPAMKDKYARYAELGNKGAKEIGFADMGALWRSGYDMTPEAFEADIERLWQDVKPLYDDLHCYTRKKLRAKYGKDKIPDKAPIPAHLLGNMWAQEFNNVYDLVEPYPGQGSLDVDKKLKDKRYDATKMVKLGESFFTSLGLDALPKTFWERSLFTRPKDRDVVCHASAWDVTWNDDLRIKMCIEPTEDDLITIHHELGHDYYFHYYYKLPTLFQAGANDGFHEGIGDTLALSVTPEYLKNIGLLDAVPQGDKGKLNFQMKMALDKVAFLPFGLLIDKWRWDVLNGKTPKDKYNEAWWALRTKYQGVAAPAPRSEADFDPGAKFHVPASTPYVRYFLARIYQFQFHRALCKAAGFTGPLDQCSIYGNKEAGKKLRAMLELGQSKPWPEALAVLSGEKKADAGAMLEYFAPLRAWLKDQNKGEQCGW